MIISTSCCKFPELRILPTECVHASHIILKIQAITYLNNINRLVSLVAMHFVPCEVETNIIYEGWNFNSGNYLFTTDTK